MKHLILHAVVAFLLASCGFPKEDPKPAVPSVTTIAASSITAVSANTGGNVIKDGGSEILVRGICWNTSGTPTTEDHTSAEGSGSGTFTSSLTGLKSAAKIYLRAYATNKTGTGYGDQIEITTLKAVPSNGLIGWWPFNGNANDESGNGNNGSVNGPVLSTDRFGNESSAFDFDGLDDFFQAQVASLPVDNASRSFSFYIKYAAPAGYTEPCAVLSYSSGTGINGALNDIFVNPGDALYFNANEFTVISAAGKSLRNSWHHVVIAYDNSSLLTGFKIYVDGSSIDPTVSNLGGISGLGTLSSDLFFGKTSQTYYPSIYPAGFNYPFKGMIDDVAVFNRVLSADEVDKMYRNAGF